MKVEVACRIRPRLEYLGETGEIACAKKVDVSTLHMVTSGDEKYAERKHTFTFTYVFDEDDTQSDIYNDACVQLIDSTLDGHNATLLAYGQTGSGKTFTILGEVDDRSEDFLTPNSGIFLRAMNDLLSYKNSNSTTSHIVIGLSIVEVYNDAVRDLLTPTATPKIQQDTVVGVGREMVNHIRDVYKAFKFANEQRAVTCTDMNERSSRSHAVFMVEILQQEKTERNPDPPGFDPNAPSNGLPVKKSKISLVDLAGSERLKRSHAEGKALTEAQNINKSLSALGNVVNALYENSKHVPFRDSTLTKLLKPSFSTPSSKVLLIANTSPAESSFVETCQTLRFADRIMQLDSPTEFSFDVTSEVEYMSKLRCLEELSADVRILQVAEDYELQITKRKLAQGKEYKRNVEKFIADYKAEVEKEGDKLFKYLLNKYLNTRRVVEARVRSQNEEEALRLKLLQEEQSEAGIILEYTDKQEMIEHFMKYHKDIRTLRKNLTELKPALEELLAQEKTTETKTYKQLIKTGKEINKFIKECKELNKQDEEMEEQLVQEEKEQAAAEAKAAMATEETLDSTTAGGADRDTEAGMETVASSRDDVSDSEEGVSNHDPDAGNDNAHWMSTEDGSALNTYVPTVPSEQELRDEENAPVCPSIVHREATDQQNLRHISDMLGTVLKPRHVHIAPISSGEIRSYIGHSAAVYSCDFYKTGEVFASASRDKTLRVWRAESGSTQHILTGHTGFVLSCNFDPTSAHIASCSEDKTVKIWDAETGKKIQTLKGHNETVYCVQYGPNGKEIASTSRDKTIRIWDASSGKKITTLKGHNGSVFCAAFSPDGRKLLSSANDKLMKMWDWTTGKETLTFAGHSTTVWSCCFSPDGQHFLSSSQDNTMKMWNLTGEETQTFKGHQGPIYHAIFVKDGTKIVSASGDKTLKIWDVNAGREANTLIGHNRTIYHCAVFNSLILSCSDTIVKAWRLKTS